MNLFRTLTAAAAVLLAAFQTSASVLEPFPAGWKWISGSEVAFSYDMSFTDSTAFCIDAKTLRRRDGVSAPERYSIFPVSPEGAVNLTYSPDSTMLAFTRANDLYVIEIESGRETRLTFDGTELILNGYASWVYYEEIFGRPSMYRAFWWSPDSRKIAYYRFDNTKVPLFPIYSPFGQDGSVRSTRYPKAGETNPEVRIGMIDLDSEARETVWADFNPSDDQYFGPPFWGDDSRSFYVQRMPRLQNTVDLFRIDSNTGAKDAIYHESYKTWIDWIDGMLFGENGLYMVRNFETGWQQAYYLSYDGGDFRRLTEGPNWSMSLVRVDEKKGELFFTAKRDATTRQVLYRVDSKGVITALTDVAFNASGISFSPDGRWFVADLSNARTPDRLVLTDLKGGKIKTTMVADRKGKDFDADAFGCPQAVQITTRDGLVLPGFIIYPEGFDPRRQYPVHVDIYGGPDTPMVRDRFSYRDNWWRENGIIELIADCRAAGHNGREGLDHIYRNLTVNEVADFIDWAKWLQSKPYVKPDKIGVEGFSFGGTMTAMLLFQASDYFHYGIAGGGVYDWAFYDTHYTERYMDTPQNNPEGYAAGRVLDYAKDYPVMHGSSAAIEPVMLKLTHGTGDDNVHFQNTLRLIDALQKENRKFDFMIYPDGMHGYRGKQHVHDNAAAREFWSRYLLEK
ncbi:MAG: DPP IV N-terminal domain-containing protein [Bacteroidales bacterium]|nr:DPP IV N-terminal domain-containing protein [Bacteroidales bacterium]